MQQGRAKAAVSFHRLGGRHRGCHNSTTHGGRGGDGGGHGKECKAPPFRIGSTKHLFKVRPVATGLNFGGVSGSNPFRLGAPVVVCSGARNDRAHNTGTSKHPLRH